jgi:ferredoxin-NADP reductase
MKPKQRVCLLAGGSGITPMYSIALASSLAKDGVEVWFLFSNKTKDDILCKAELDKLAETNPKFHLFHTLTRHKPEHGEWDGI